MASYGLLVILAAFRICQGHARGDGDRSAQRSRIRELLDLHGDGRLEVQKEASPHIRSRSRRKYAKRFTTAYYHLPGRDVRSWNADFCRHPVFFVCARISVGLHSPEPGICSLGNPDQSVGHQSLDYWTSDRKRANRGPDCVRIFLRAAPSAWPKRPMVSNARFQPHRSGWLRVRHVLLRPWGLLIRERNRGVGLTHNWKATAGYQQPDRNSPDTKGNCAGPGRFLVTLCTQRGRC